MPELPEERWTIQVCEDHRALDCALCGVFDVIEVVAADDLSSILRDLERALGLAEKFEKEAWEWKAKALSGGPVAATPPTGNDGPDTAAFTHICLDCGKLGRNGSYHDHGNGEAGDVASLSDVLAQLKRGGEALDRLEAAEGERDDALRALGQRENVLARLESVEGERDRLREAAQAVDKFVGCNAVGEARYDRKPVKDADASAALLILHDELLEPERKTLADNEARAALSTGDRQDDDSHVRAAEATQPGIARHDGEGGAS